MNRPLIAATIVFTLTLSFLLFYMTKTGKDDVARYETLLKVSRSSSHNSPFGVKQERKGVHKQILLNKLGVRHEVTLQCPKSEMALINGSELVEKLENVTCSMQEKLYFDEDNKPIQEVRELKSKMAFLSYQDHLFKGEDVILSQFTCSGHVLGLNHKSVMMLMKGKAQAANFSLGEELQFKAQNLKASFYPSEKS